MGRKAFTFIPAAGYYETELKSNSVAMRRIDDSAGRVIETHFPPEPVITAVEVRANTCSAAPDAAVSVSTEAKEPVKADADAADKIIAFFRDGKTKVLKDNGRMPPGISREPLPHWDSSASPLLGIDLGMHDYEYQGFGVEFAWNGEILKSLKAKGKKMKPVKPKADMIALATQLKQREEELRVLDLLSNRGYTVRHTDGQPTAGRRLAVFFCHSYNPHADAQTRLEDQFTEELKTNLAKKFVADKRAWTRKAIARLKAEIRKASSEL